MLFIIIKSKSNISKNIQVCRILQVDDDKDVFILIAGKGRMIDYKSSDLLLFIIRPFISMVRTKFEQGLIRNNRDGNEGITVGAVREPPNAQNIQKTIFGRFANRPYSKSLSKLDGKGSKLGSGFY
ncbi:hypothetical protein D0T87_18065 [Bacteroides sp. 51]|nr:hypothetical protein [Bacteroides sp. 51]